MGIYKDQQRFFARVIEQAVREEQRRLIFLTLNTHLVLPNRECRSRRDRFFYGMHRRCFRASRFGSSPTASLLRVYGAMERGPVTGHPHLHMLIWVDGRAFDNFVRVADARWKAVSPGGATTLLIVEDPLLSAGRLAGYLTKQVDLPEFHDELFTVADLDLPEFGGQVRQKARTARSPDTRHSTRG